MWFVPVILISFMIAVSVTSTAISMIRPATDKYTGIWGQTRLKKFSSYEELKNFIIEAYRANNSYSSVRIDNGVILVPLAMSWAPNSEYNSDYIKYIINPMSDTSVDYSTTNIQVEGVDEADIVKTDGRYIYVVTGEKVVIIEAYPAETTRVLSEIGLVHIPEDSATPIEIFINQDKLVIFWRITHSWVEPRFVVLQNNSIPNRDSILVQVYDISDRENPILKRQISSDGNYFSSRMIGDFVYVIITSPVNCWDDPIPLPVLHSNGESKTVEANEIYYFENSEDTCYNFTTIMAINSQNDEASIVSETFLIGTTQDIFVSLNNIYITQSTCKWYSESEKTTVHKISVSNRTIEYKGMGEVPGYVLNQFSMDEYQGYFRIATTTGNTWDGSAKNHVYVLDEDLNIVGRLENIASGERIYSVRFMGGRAYLVTFKQVDPLFVLDLADPTNPRVLGELELPGYSDYLHPYDENHIIGIGKDTIDAGSFAWRQGVKISLFDVSDPANPIEISRYVIGDRGTEWGDSYALSDHRAFLFSRERNLLVVPIELAERESSDVSPWTYGVRVWQGAYVFNISLEEGLVLKGRISHSENSQSLWSSYGSQVRRSIYIENVLYTISDGLVKMNNLADLSEIGSIELPPGVCLH
jgi:uncharacterized secreted protein with C-terminal beta-propeller domain